MVVTEPFGAGRRRYPVISLDARVWLREPHGIIHLINVLRQLMNMHDFHLTAPRQHSNGVGGRG